MSTIYQKIKGAADKKRRSFVSLESKDGTVSPTKLNQTLVKGSEGLSKKFVNHSNALMDGYESTLDADGATFGDDLEADGKGDNPFGGINLEGFGLGKYKSVTKSDPENEAKKALKSKTTKTTRVGEDGKPTEFDLDGVASTVDDVVTLTPGGIVDNGEDQMSNEDWKKFTAQETEQDKIDRAAAEVARGRREEDKEEKSVEINPLEDNKEVTTETPGTKKKYNMGWMESRNAKRATNVQRRQAKKETRQNERLIKKFEKTEGNNSDSERMSPEVRAAYAHFTEDKPKTKFDSKIGSTSGRDTEGTSDTKITKGPKDGTGNTKIDSEGNVIPPVAEYKSATKKLTSPGKFKLKGSTYKKQ